MASKSSSELAQFTKDVYAFYKKRFEQSGSPLTAELLFVHIAEEVGEIARQLFSRKSKMRKFDSKNLKDEIAQVLIELLVLAELEGVPVEKAMREKFREISKRYGKKP